MTVKHRSELSLVVVFETLWAEVAVSFVYLQDSCSTATFPRSFPTPIRDYLVRDAAWWFLVLVLDANLKREA
jgi:hypothetical protein